MLKIILCISIITSMAFIGNDILKKHKNRLRLIAELLKLFEDMQVNISTLNTSATDFIKEHDFKNLKIIKSSFEEIQKNLKTDKEKSLSDMLAEKKENYPFSLLDINEFNIIESTLIKSERNDIDDVNASLNELISWLKQKSKYISEDEIKKASVIKKIALLSSFVAVICII